MLNKIEDIYRALDAKAYLSALALSLTLPDICASVYFKKVKPNGCDYAEWFNKYVADQYSPPGDITKAFDGNACYSLRCKFLHSGNLDIKNEKINVSIDTFDLCINGCNTFSREYHIGKENDAIYYVRLSIPDLCNNICEAARSFYIDWEDEHCFEDVSINLIDIEQETAKLQALINYD